MKEKKRMTIGALGEPPNAKRKKEWHYKITLKTREPILNQDASVIFLKLNEAIPGKIMEVHCKEEIEG